MIIAKLTKKTYALRSLGKATGSPPERNVTRWDEITCSFFQQRGMKGDFAKWWLLSTKTALAQKLNYDSIVTQMEWSSLLQSILKENRKPCYTWIRLAKYDHGPCGEPMGRGLDNKEAFWNWRLPEVINELRYRCIYYIYTYIYIYIYILYIYIYIYILKLYALPYFFATLT